jgi:hypothetical protein
MFYSIDFEREFNISQKIKKNFNKNQNCFSIPKNGYIWVEGVDLVHEDNSTENILDIPYLIEKPTKKPNYKNFIPDNKEKYIFWEFSHLNYSNTISNSDYNFKVKNNIVKFANKYGSLTKGIKLVSSKYSIHSSEHEDSKNYHWAENINKGIKITDRIYFPIYGEPFSLWMIEIMKMQSLIILWKAIIDKDMDILNKIILWREDKIYYVLTPSREKLENIKKNMKPQNNNLDNSSKNRKVIVNVNEPLFASGILAEKESKNKDQYINSDKFNESKNEEVLKLAKFLLKRLVRNITKEVFFKYCKDVQNTMYFPINFNPNKINIIPNNLLSYMWLEFYKLTQKDVEIKWCSLCGGPEDFSKKRSDWENHKICISKFHQKKYQDLKLYEENDDIKEEDIVERWKNNPWNLNITINDVREWINKKEKNKKEKE